MEAEQRRLILEEIKKSFEEEVLMSLSQREKYLRTGGTNPYYIYGFTICSRIGYFSNDIIGKKLSLNDFPELLFVREVNVYGSTWFDEYDVESRIKAIDEAIKYNKQWS